MASLSVIGSFSPLCRYFIFADTCLITQYIYFQTLQHRKERLLRLPHQQMSSADPLYRHAVRQPASVDEVPAVLCIVHRPAHYRQPTQAEYHVLLHCQKHAAAQK